MRTFKHGYNHRHINLEELSRRYEVKNRIPGYNDDGEGPYDYCEDGDSRCLSQNCPCVDNCIYRWQYARARDMTLLRSALHSAGPTAIAFLAFAAAMLLLLVGVTLVHARDDGRYAASPNKAWMDSLRSRKGPCCSDADGRALADVDWDSKDGHYRVRIEERWWDVPDEAVITEPNRIGRTMVWPTYRRWSDKTDHVSIDIVCFMPGEMT